MAKCVRRTESKVERMEGTEERRESTCDTVDFLICFCDCLFVSLCIGYWLQLQWKLKKSRIR